MPLRPADPAELILIHRPFGVAAANPLRLRIDPAEIFPERPGAGIPDRLLKPVNAGFDCARLLFIFRLLFAVAQISAPLGEMKKRPGQLVRLQRLIERKFPVEIGDEMGFPPKLLRRKQPQQPTTAV